MLDAACDLLGSDMCLNTTVEIRNWQSATNEEIKTHLGAKEHQALRGCLLSFTPAG